MKLHLPVLATCAAILAGCATNYEGYAEANVKIAQARAQAERHDNNHDRQHAYAYSSPAQPE